jgi:hypothetical protein
VNLKSNLLVHFSLALLLFCLSVTVGLAQSPSGPVATTSVGATGITWTPKVSYARLVLIVNGPSGPSRQEYGAGSKPFFAVAGHAAGSYTYELQVVPQVDAETQAALAAAATSDNRDEVVRQLQAAGKLPSQELTQAGAFAIQGGQIVMGAYTGSDTDAGIARQDVVVADDQIVQGSACVGLDCVNNESFGFDTVRLKENNTRIKFDDTSTSAGFPATDWQLTANDSASGGRNMFAIEDVTGGKVPFTVIAGAPTNSIYVNSSGKLGLKTTAPVLDVHVASGDTPAFRMEQNSAGGFTAQTWDIGANEANFFVRDVTGGSRLPFRIRPGAPTSSIDIAASGNVGIGTASPVAKLDVQGSAVISGSLLLNGSLTEYSDANAKKNFAPVNGQSVLARLAEMPIRTWSYQSDPASVRHMGPTAQDFQAAFQLGQDDRHIAPIDTNGVALAGIQELYRLMKQKDTQIAQLAEQNAQLEKRLAAIEAR